jgi:hypothetical protein
MQSTPRRFGRGPRQWERQWTGRQRGVISLALVAATAGAGFSLWQQWRATEPAGLAAAEPGPGAPAGRNYGLPVPEGAYIVLPPGAIPAIKDPQFLPVSLAQVNPTSPMILVTLKGETHVYSIYLLDGHEIVNDRVPSGRGGEPVATTW